MAADFIVGIYNYCDYWCDRCAFTRRCRNFAMGEEMRKTERLKARSDEDNACFWDSIEGTFANAREQLDALAESRFADDLFEGLDEIDDDDLEASMQREEMTRRAVYAHPLVMLARTYCTEVAKWSESAKQDIAASVKDIVSRARIGFDDTVGTARREFDALEEMMDVILWYHTLLPPKTCRYVDDMMRDGPASGSDGEDTLGTAKLLLVSADRCISAWMHIREHLPTQEDSILRFLVMLDRFRRMIERQSPSARAHIRPGLDE